MVVNKGKFRWKSKSLLSFSPTSEPNEPNKKDKHWQMDHQFSV